MPRYLVFRDKTQNKIEDAVNIRFICFKLWSTTCSGLFRIKIQNTSGGGVVARKSRFRLFRCHRVCNSCRIHSTTYLLHTDKHTCVAVFLTLGLVLVFRRLIYYNRSYMPFPHSFKIIFLVVFALSGSVKNDGMK